MRTEISQDYTAKVGDVLEYQFKILNVFQESQINAILADVQAIPEITVRDYRVDEHWFYSYLTLTVEVTNNPFPVLIVATVAIGTAGAIFLYLALDKIYLITKESPITGFTLSLAIPIIAGLAVLWIWKK